MGDEKAVEEIPRASRAREVIQRNRAKVLVTDASRSKLART